MSLFELATPCAIVDPGRVAANTRRMADRATRLGVRLRPHVKTHKTAEGARLQVGDHFGGLTVSTASEARAFADWGFSDLTWAVPLPPSKASIAADIGQRDDVERLQVLVDSSEAVDGLEAEARRRGWRFDTLLKVDCGYGRAGVDPLGAEGLALAQRLQDSPHVRFHGVLAHGGHSYDCVGRGALLSVARQERDVTLAFAERLRAAGVEVADVSTGSTPTCTVAEELPGGLAGVTEIRPGNYAYYDAFQATLGTCSYDDVAFSVLVTVIATYPQRGSALTDGGAIAFTKDPGAAHIPGERSTFGAVFDATLTRRLDLDLSGLSQEHGKLKALVSDEDLRGLRIGDRLRVVPNHSCLTAAAHTAHHLVEGTDVVGQWSPCRGW